MEQIRLEAETREQLDSCLEFLTQAILAAGGKLAITRGPYRGHKGGWLAYGIVVQPDPRTKTEIIKFDPTTGEILD